MAMSIRLLGQEEAEALLARVHEGIQEAGHVVTRVGTNVSYAWPVHFGRKKRKGAFFLTDPLEAMRPEIVRQLAEALLGGPAEVARVSLRLGYTLEGRAKPLVPVRTGNLRRSVHTIQERR